MKSVVYEVKVSVTEEQVKSFLPFLNKELEEEDETLTYEELIGNKELLKYVCESAVEDGVALYDPFEFWNNDGWCDWKDYR